MLRADGKKPQRTATLALDKKTVEALAADYAAEPLPKRARSPSPCCMPWRRPASLSRPGWIPISRKFNNSLTSRSTLTIRTSGIYSLLRLVLQLDAPELIALPWEAMTDVWARAGHNTLVVRTVSQPSDMAKTPLDLPLTMLQVDESLPAAARPDSAGDAGPAGPGVAPDAGQPGRFRLETTIKAVFRRIEQADVDDIVRVRGVSSWEEVSKLTDAAWTRVDALHLKVRHSCRDWMGHQYLYICDSPIVPFEMRGAGDRRAGPMAERRTRRAWSCSMHPSGVGATRSLRYPWPISLRRSAASSSW